MKSKPSVIQNKRFSDNLLPCLLILLFSFILYGNTLFNDYALDDLIVIKSNSFTQKGVAGIKEIFSYDSFTGFYRVQKNLVAGGRYRPLSIASFAVEYSLMNGLNPYVSHLMNIILYGLTGCLIFLILSKLLPPGKGNPWYTGIPFITTLLFLAHPIHTEVVANIKSRDELLAMFFALAALWFTLRYLDTHKFKHAGMAGFTFFLGLLSKENALMFVIIIPLTIHFFTGHSIRKNLLSAIPLLIISVVFIFIRFLVLGYFNSTQIPRELLNNPFLDATAGQKYGTILLTLGMYLKLLFIPHPLTHDYYPYHIPLVSLTDYRAIIPFMIYAGLLVYAITGIAKRKIVPFGIFYYCITLFMVSNILFPVGTFMNERFLYIPSLGFILILAWFLSLKMREWIRNEHTYKIVFYSALFIIIALFSIKTIARNRIWKDDFTLFSTDVKVSSNSSKANTTAGGAYMEKAQKEQDTILKDRYFNSSKQYLSNALTIYPENLNARILLGNVHYFQHKDCKGALKEYLTVLGYDPRNDLSFQNALKILPGVDNATETDYKIRICRSIDRLHPQSGEVNYLMGRLYGEFKNNFDSSEYYLNRAIEYSPEMKDAYRDLGILYGMKKQYEKSLDLFQKALNIDPNDENIKKNIILTNHFLDELKKK
ncbi:MAG: tetratricopeptide repeat protein [Bacteroidetes bacterium]|nr:tetratricopeptide repeat protein [Bacteroidota bacterium]